MHAVLSTLFSSAKSGLTETALLQFPDAQSRENKAFSTSERADGCWLTFHWSDGRRGREAFPRASPRPAFG